MSSKWTFYFHRQVSLFTWLQTEDAEASGPIDSFLFQKSGNIHALIIHCFFLHVFCPLFDLYQNADYICCSTEKVDVDNYTAWGVLHTHWPSQSFVPPVRRYSLAVFKNKQKETKRETEKLCLYTLIIYLGGKLLKENECDVLIKSQRNTLKFI